MIKRVNISRFHVASSKYLVAFPYDEDNVKVPIGKGDLLDRSPKLFRYYEQNKKFLLAQTEYSDKIIGDDSAPYYALARTGPYNHAEWYVIFRDNTKWVSAVVGEIDTEWGGRKKLHSKTIVYRFANELIELLFQKVTAHSHETEPNKVLISLSHLLRGH